MTARALRRHNPYASKHIAENFKCVLADRFEDAEAMLVFPLPPDAVDENNQPIPEKTKDLKVGRAVLVTGQIAIGLRDPANRRRMRAIVHPYRLVPRNPKAAVAAPPPKYPHRPATLTREAAPPQISSQ